MNDASHQEDEAETARRRKLANKKNNERVKLIATTLNAISIAIIGAAIVLPTIEAPGFLLTIEPWILLLLAFALHLGAQGVISLMRSED